MSFWAYRACIAQCGTPRRSTTWSKGIAVWWLEFLHEGLLKKFLVDTFLLKNSKISRLNPEASRLGHYLKVWFIAYGETPPQSSRTQGETPTDMFGRSVRTPARSKNNNGGIQCLDASPSDALDVPPKGRKYRKPKPSCIGSDAGLTFAIV